MHHNEIIEAVDRAWPRICSTQFKIKLPPKETMLKLIDIILKNNEFEFNGKYFVQKIGVSMGSPCSPSLTDLRMFEIITAIFKKYPYRESIVLLSVYRDDLFLLFNGEESKLRLFFEIANDIHPLLKFTFDISNSSLQFLDVTVFKGDRFKNSSILDLKLFRKPTENFQYLHRTSAHPASVFKGFLIGEIT